MPPSREPQAPPAGVDIPELRPSLEPPSTRSPDGVWVPVPNVDGQARNGMDLADFTGRLNRDSWPDASFASNTSTGFIQHMSLWQRRSARCEDRIRIAKDLGLANLPLREFERISCQVVAPPPSCKHGAGCWVANDALAINRRSRSKFVRQHLPWDMIAGLAKSQMESRRR